jgi:hypothetical protein
VTSATPKSARNVACPSCGKPAVFTATNPFRPFCSERCKTTDLGAWATERYRIPAKPPQEEGPEGTEQ